MPIKQHTVSVVVQHMLLVTCCLQSNSDGFAIVFRQAILDLERQRKAYSEAIEESERLLTEARRMQRQLIAADRRLKRHQVRKAFLFKYPKLFIQRLRTVVDSVPALRVGGECNGIG